MAFISLQAFTFKLFYGKLTVQQYFKPYVNKRNFHEPSFFQFL